MARLCFGLVCAAALTLAAMGSAVTAQAPPLPDIWSPPPLTTWQWQLTGSPLDQWYDVDVYDVDLFDADPLVGQRQHAKGRSAVCYLSAGTWEDWRPDAGAFPASVKGRGNGWPGEKWLDIRNLDVLGPILEARMDLCKAKGFDGVEPDNVDAYANDTGFPLTYADQIRFNTFLANAAHTRGLSVGLKNDVDQIKDLEPLFDWALNEECFRYNECDALAPFVKAGKTVLQVEYNSDPATFCATAIAKRFSSMKKHLSLDAYRVVCQ
jgi:hypothetical protein